MKVTLKIFLVLITLFVSSFVGVTQLKTVHKVINYEPNEYLAHNQNWMVVQKSNGVLYFANGDGVLEYDGSNWELYHTETRTNVLSVGIDKHETIFYGGVGEVGYLIPNKVGGYMCQEIEAPNHKDLLVSEFFWETHVFENCVIFRSDNYLIQYSKDSVNVINVKEIKVNGSYLVNNELWLRTDNKNIFSVNSDKLLTTKSLKSKLVFDSVDFSVQDILFSHKEKVILVSNSNMLYAGNTVDNKITVFKTQLDDLNQININEGVLLPSGEFVISTINAGVYVLNSKGEIVTHYNDQNGLKTNTIRGVYFDREGLLWFTTDVGISKALFNKPFSWMPYAFDKVKGNANSLIEMDNKLFIATNEGVFIVDGSSSELSVRRVGELPLQSFDLAKVGRDVFVATTGGLFILQKGTLKPIITNYSRAILPLSDTYIVVGGKKSIFQIQKIEGQWRLKDSTSVSDEVLHLEKDPNNSQTCWGGLYSSGVAKVEIDTILNTCTYKTYNPDLSGVEGYILPYQANGRMMFAPKSSGVYNLDESENKFIIDQLIEKEIGKDLSCWLIKEDIYSNLYVEDSGPVYIIRNSNGQTYLDSTSLTNLNIGYINDIYCSEKGITWLVGELGIVRFDPMEVKSIQKSFQAIIKGVYLNGDSVLLEGSYFDTDKSMELGVLNYGYHNISFTYSSPQFSSEVTQLYAYRLVGFNNRFSEWGVDRKAIYTNLNEGDYIFQVKSLNAEGVESSVAEFRFKVLAPWYRTYLAYGLYFLLFIALIYFIVRIYSFRLEKMNKKLQEIVLEKTSVITANMEELALQKEQLQERNNDIIGSIHYAKQLQRAILPSDKTLKTNLVNYFVYYQPKDIVAGDFYWISKSKDGNEFFVSVADCTGHGVPGALVSVVCSDALNTAVNEYKLKNTNEILDAVNLMVMETFNPDNKTSDTDTEYMVRDGMDLALCKLDLNAKSISFSGANNPLWLFSEEIYNLDVFYSENGMFIYELKADRQPIGGFSSLNNFNAQTFKVSKGDVVYMFTDGIVDQFGSWKAGDKIKKFKRINLAKSLMAMQHVSIEQQQAEIHKLFAKWKGNNDQIDDVTIMGIKIS